MSWYCKKNVLNDIAHVTGSSVKELDEQYIVVGEQPPPVRTKNEVDDEFLLRFGELGSKTHVENEQNPDLAGIKEMLRMVDKLQDPVQEMTVQNERKEEDSKDSIVTISKLNPSVPEFTPKNAFDSRSSELDKIGTKDQDADSSSSKNKYETLGISSEKLDPTTLKEVSDKLKQKISSPSVETCLRKKTERNLAIATLLKLYSDKPANGEITENKHKLLTPQDFEKPCLNNEKSVNDSRTSSQSSTKEEDIKNTAENTKHHNNKLIQESVSKVQNWFKRDEKPSPKEPALYLGPITFKKKEIIKPTTSSFENTDKVYKKVESFVPSEYANKLTETYMVRNKTKDDKDGNIWTKLERELKAKDEIIKKKENCLPKILTNLLIEKLVIKYFLVIVLFLCIGLFI